jgi:Xaa-Pro aminopeptidase
MFIVRDIEMQRARQHARADRISCPADHAPQGGLSGDRETATAEATAEYLTRQAVTSITTDRSLPYIFAYHIQQRGISIQYDPQLGILERRQKDADEAAWLQESQRVTEQAMRMACELIANADVNDDGLLIHQNEVLTSERVRSAIDVFLLERDYFNPKSIVACGPTGADCHDYGTGPLSTEQPVIVDIFPRNRKTLYYGDCTRTVVHGQASDDLVRMHMAVCEANAAGCAAAQPGVTGEFVHKATIQVILENGYQTGLPSDDEPDSFCSMTHGTGHAVGLEVHEPPLLDFGGPELLLGDCLTIEPGLYCRALGGVRVEDMIILTEDGCRNLNTLYTGLDWKV